MTISSIGGNAIGAQLHMPQHVAKGSEAGEAGPEIDGDADDAASRATAATPHAPSVNANGQTVGQLINVTA